MEWKDMPRRAYYEKYERVQVKNDYGWYEVYRLPGNVYGFAEPQHFQEVNFYLIMGEERSILLDTGMGFFPVEPLIRELYDGEIIAVNSHFHFDHIGNDHTFETVWNYTDNYVKKVAETGLVSADTGAQMDEEMFKYGYPEGFNPETFHIPAFTYRTLEDGQIFDLGGRKLEVIHTPGHSFDSIMLYDEAGKILFTGDTFYLGALYAHFACDQFGHSDIYQYQQTMEMLSKKIPEDVKLYCSHNDFITYAGRLREAAELLKAVISEESRESGEVNLGHQYLEEGRMLNERFGDGFSVVYAVDGKK